ncbi:unnamed protein product, partial [Amoebophrya sp. A120]
VWSQSTRPVAKKSKRNSKNDHKNPKQKQVRCNCHRGEKRRSGGWSTAPILTTHCTCGTST